MKICNTCKLELSLDKFHTKRQLLKSGEWAIYYRFHCKECDKKKRNKWREKNPLKWKLYHKEYYRKHQKHYKELAEAYRDRR